MRMVRLIIILYVVRNLIVMMIKIDTIIIINITIKEELVIMMPLGFIVILNTPRQSCGDYNEDIKNKIDRIIENEGNRICKEERIKIKRDDRGNREGVSI